RSRKGCSGSTGPCAWTPGTVPPTRHSPAIINAPARRSRPSGTGGLPKPRTQGAELMPHRRSEPLIQPPGRRFARRCSLLVSLAPCLLVCLLGCRASAPGAARAAPTAPPWFEDVTEMVGLDFVHDAGPVDGSKYFMPQIVGSGAAVFDFDGDGLLDIYLLNNGGPRGQTNRPVNQPPRRKVPCRSRGS